MDRSLYPEGVEVRQSNLSNTEDTRSFHTLQRHTDNTSRGVVSGLLVTINSTTPTTIDVQSGNGYAPSGEYVELTSNITSTLLEDTTLSIVNLIILVYTETNNNIQPHETNGNSFPTTANRSSRILVLTQAQFDVLPETDNNLDNNAKDRSLLLAKITAQGSGISLTPDNVEIPSNLSGGVTAINTTNTITGVDISRIDTETQTGSGALSFDFGATELTWTAPGDTSGTPVSVVAGGLFSLPSLPSNTNLIVLVSESILPASNQADIIFVTNIYTQSVPRHSTEDVQHRSFIGTGIPTLTNPHGLTLEDLGIGANDTIVHQDLFHSNGIHRDSAASTLATSVNTGGIPHSVGVTAPGVGDRIYLDGELHTAISTTSIVFTDVAVNQQQLYDIYAIEGSSGIATISKMLRAEYDNDSPPGANVLATVIQLKNLDRQTGAGAANIRFTSGPDTLEYEAPGDAFGTAVAVPSGSANALRLFSSNGTEFIDIFAEDFTSWPALGTTTEPLTIFALPAGIDDNLLITTVMFSGTSTGFVGNGFAAGNSPNNIIDQRLFGMSGLDDLRDEARFWLPLNSTESDQVDDAFTMRDVTIGTTTPNSTKKLYAVGDAGTTKVGVGGVGGSSGGIGVTGLGIGAAAGVSGVGGITNGPGIVGQGTNLGSGVEGAGGATVGSIGVKGTSGIDGRGVEGNAVADGDGVYGAAAGTGAAVRGVATVNAVAMAAMGVAAAPVRGSLFINPQDADASSPSQGEMQVRDTGGKLNLYNGTTHDRYVAQSFSNNAVDDIVGPGVFTTSYTVPANALRVGSTLRVSFGGVVLVAADANPFFWSLQFAGVGIDTSQRVPVFLDIASMQLMILVTSAGAGGNMERNGFYYNGTGGQGVGGPNMDNSATVVGGGINTTIANTVTASITGIGSVSTFRLKSLIVDVL